MRKLGLLLILVLLPSMCFAAKKQREWQTGKLLDTDRSRYFAGTTGSASSQGSAQVHGNTATYNGQSNGSSVAIYRTYQDYVIESDKYIFVVEERIKWRWSKAARLIVNAPVKFSIEKQKLYLLDDDGKEHETKIVKQILKTPPK